MKNQYLDYKQGSTLEIKNRLDEKSKKILAEFLKYIISRNGTGQNKVDDIERYMLQFYDIVEKPLNKLKKQDIDDFMVLLNNSDKSKWTKKGTRIYIKSFLLWLYRDLDMIQNIRTPIKDQGKVLNDEKINENNLITEEELEKMIRKAENFRDKALLMLLWETGARPQEIVNLKWRDMKLEAEYPDVTLHSGKTEETRQFPVKEAKIHLQRWKQEYCYPNQNNNDFVFPNPNNRDNPITTAGINKILRRMAKKSGINKDVWSYLFRHTRATRLYEELPQQIVEKLMGHKDMAGVYAHISSKKAREEMIKKVYHVEELTPEQKNRIQKLEAELKITNEKFSEENIKKLVFELAGSYFKEQNKDYKMTFGSSMKQKPIKKN
ncbi:MAG: site-specific integrase [Candidatus Pacearchaeota archaeon]|nr:site-specific integrase [Candidatus Pacearchaeota archaeon]